MTNWQFKTPPMHACIIHNSSYTKTIHTVRAHTMLVLLIIHTAMLINENYYSNKYCCLNKQQKMKLLPSLW